MISLIGPNVHWSRFQDRLLNESVIAGDDKLFSIYHDALISRQQIR